MKTKRRKHHIVVDTMENPVQVIMHAANAHNTKPGCDVWKRFEAFSGGAGYRGTAMDFMENSLQLKSHISKKIKDTFYVLPMRWVVERTFAWLGSFRHLSKGYEILADSAENMIQIAMIQITIAKCV